MIVVGTDRDDMARAANILRKVGGGAVVVSRGETLALVELPIAGLMSDERAEVVAKKADQLVAAMKTCGCTLNNAYMQHSLLALVVIRSCAFPTSGWWTCGPSRRWSCSSENPALRGFYPGLLCLPAGR